MSNRLSEAMIPIMEMVPVIPVIRIDDTRAKQTFEAHAALLRAERDNPALRDNPAWTMLRQDAFERFNDAFKVLP